MNFYKTMRGNEEPWYWRSGVSAYKHCIEDCANLPHRVEEAIGECLEINGHTITRIPPWVYEGELG